MQIIASMLLSAVLGFFFTLTPNVFQGGEVNEQVNKSTTLAPGSNVRISGINGRVSIETWDGEQAEINITIKASDREAMERRPLLVDYTANSLTIRTENDREGKGWGRERGWVRHDVRLKLPRAIDLKVNGVNGAVNVGQITGVAELSGINGRVDVAQAGTASQLSGINGRTSITLLRLGDGGLRVSGINGGVEIGLPATANADVDVSGINGGVDSDLPITVIGEMRRGQLRGKLGAGGPAIRVSGINGGVTLRRN
ncbi:MAG: hypothetical protein JNJ50_18985 [Acidobacteria bacterium]|nr:hypothetical protein [Acidobacteriota bacterium]